MESICVVTCLLLHTALVQAYQAYSPGTGLPGSALGGLQHRYPDTCLPVYGHYTAQLCEARGQFILVTKCTSVRVQSGGTRQTRSGSQCVKCEGRRVLLTVALCVTQQWMIPP